MELDTNAIDAAAAAAAAEPPAPTAPEAPVSETGEPAGPQYPTIEHNATGPDVVKLVNLLVYLDFASAETHGKHVLDGDVLADVDRARAELGVNETPPEQVGPATWAALYEAAASKGHAGG